MHFLWKSLKTVEPQLTFVGEERTAEVACQLYTYNEDHYTVDENVDIDSLSMESLADVSWLNLHGINNIDMIEKISTILNLDSIVKNDIPNTNQRPKLKVFDKYIFFSIKSILPKSDDNIEVEQISFVLGQAYLISFQEKVSDHFQHIRGRIREKQGKVREKKSDYLLYLLLEAIIDNYFETIHRFWPKIEKLIQIDSNDNSNDTLIEIEHMRKTFHIMSKAITPFKESMTLILKNESSILNPKSLKYYTDLKDQSLHVIDEINFILQQLESGANLHFSFQSQRMNEVMKTLTMVSTIFIPLTFIAGIYGMNFEYMPELKFEYSYPIVILAMIAISGFIFTFFKRKKWF